MPRRRKVPKQQAPLGLEVEAVPEVIPDQDYIPTVRRGHCHKCGNPICVICGRQVSVSRKANLVATGRGTYVHRGCRKEELDAVWPLPTVCEHCPTNEQKGALASV